MSRLFLLISCKLLPFDLVGIFITVLGDVQVELRMIQKIFV